MKISLKWISKYIDLKDILKEPEKGIEKVSELLTFGGLEVEGIENQAQTFKNVVIGKILEKNKHPNADQLTLCLVSTGDATHKIVCGAKNHNAGDTVVVALPGAILPGNFEIKISKIRGEESKGMLCSEKELGLAENSEGIMILPANAPVGESFSKYAKLDDILLDIKVTPNRADCLSHIGLAREIGSLMGRSWELPTMPITDGRESTRKLSKVTVEDAEACPRYAGRLIQNVKVGPSPEWLKSSLESIGLRSINNVVDITNFVMMELGQPLHAFDFEKIRGAQLIVRKAKPGENFTTLEDKKLTLDGSELMICDQEGPVALAGVMGGLDSGVTDSTKTVFIESANFLPSIVRRTSRKFGMESDSSYRFSRGCDPEMVPIALNRAAHLMQDLCGATVCADIHDFYPRPTVRPRIELDLKFISSRLGFNLEAVEAKRHLEKIGCNVTGSGAKITVIPPAFRADIKIQEDLGEEILRVKGFSAIPETLPSLTAEPTSDNKTFSLEFRLARTLNSLGINQALNLSFISEKKDQDFFKNNSVGMKECGLPFEFNSVKIINPINVDLAVMRRSLLPSLMDNVAFNVRHGNSYGRIFEIAPVFYQKSQKDIDGSDRPFSEHDQCGFVFWGKPKVHWLKSPDRNLFFELKGTVEGWFRSWSYKSVKFESMEPSPSFVHPGQWCRVVVEGRPVGFLATAHPDLLDRWNVTGEVAFAEFNLANLFNGQPRFSRYKNISKFPRVERDVAYLASVNTPTGDILADLIKAGGNLLTSCEVFDVFEGTNLGPGKRSVAFRLIYQDQNKTLSDEEVNAVHANTIQSVAQKHQLSIR